MPTASPQVAACSYAGGSTTEPACVALVGYGGDAGRYLVDVYHVLADIRFVLILTVVMLTFLGVLTAFRLTWGR